MAYACGFTINVSKTFCKMTKLKTLKDIFPECICGDGEVKKECPNIWHEGRSDGFNKDLKAKAVKWARKYKNTESKMTFSDDLAVYTFIKHFFNLTEEDLK